MYEWDLPEKEERKLKRREWNMKLWETQDSFRKQ